MYGLDNYTWSNTSIVSLIFRKDRDKVKKCTDKEEQSRNGH